MTTWDRVKQNMKKMDFMVQNRRKKKIIFCLCRKYIENNEGFNYSDVYSQLSYEDDIAQAA